MKKSRFFTIIMLVVLLLFTVSLTSCDFLGGGNGIEIKNPLVTEPPTPKLTKIYNLYCTGSSCAEVGNDGSYLSIDTNPYNIEDYVDSKAVTLIGDVNDALELPDYLMNEMLHTTAMMGRQTENFESQGISVSWSYHPDNGLQVTYKDIG